MTREQRKNMWLARVSCLSRGADNYNDIMVEAREKFDKLNPINENDNDNN